jgi:hypothetical protein
VPEPGSLLLVAVGPFLRGVDVDIGQFLFPGEQPGVRGEAAVSFRCALPSCRTFPQFSDLRKEPRVDGARIPPKTASIAPSRRRSMPSILSAPAAMPVIRHIAFVAALAPQGPPGRSPARESRRPAWSASARSGVSPACVRRFGSSRDDVVNDAAPAIGGCEAIIDQPLILGQD